jgi:hypothetical protein
MNSTLKRCGIYASLVTVTALATLLAVRARAAGIPDADVLTYTGYLEDADGRPLTDELSGISLEVWDAAEAGKRLCDTSVENVTPQAGRFQLVLPAECVDAVKATPNVWIDVKVEGASLGRTKLGAVPYAVEAGHATSADEAQAAGGALAQQIVPAGAVLAFNLPTCPAGWSRFDPAGGRAIVGVNASGANGLSQRKLNDTMGEENHTMTVSEMPPHTHSILIYDAGSGPNEGTWNLTWDVFGSQNAKPPLRGSGIQNFMANQPAGGGTPFTNMQPSIALLYCLKN